MHGGKSNPNNLVEAERMTESQPQAQTPDVAAAGDAPATEPQRQRRVATAWHSSDVLRTAALVMAIYVVLRLLWFANALVLTAFLGVLFGLAVASGTDRLQRFRIPRGVGAAMIVIAFFGLLVGFGAWVAPTLRAQGTELRHRLPEAVDRLETWINSREGGFVGLVVNGISSPAHDSTAVAKPGTQPIPVTVDTVTAAARLRDRIGKQMSGSTRFLFPFISSTLEVLAGLALIVFMSIYIAADPNMYHAGIMHLFPHGARERAGEVLSAMADILRRWLVTQLIAMASIGAVATVVLLILKVKAAFALGVLAGLFEFIPTVGPIFSALPAIAMGFLDSPEKALYVMVAYFGIQFVENHLLIPLLMKGGMNLPPALTILSQALMVLVFGFLGLMCAVPLLAATMVAVKMLYVQGVVGDPAFAPGEHPEQGVNA
jgi:predicted PurR-regulated permease PerM